MIRDKELKDMSIDRLKLLLASGVKGDEYKQVMQEYIKRKTQQ